MPPTRRNPTSRIGNRRQGWPARRRIRIAGPAGPSTTCEESPTDFRPVGDSSRLEAPALAATSTASQGAQRAASNLGAVGDDGAAGGRSDARPWGAAWNVSRGTPWRLDCETVLRAWPVLGRRAARISKCRQPRRASLHQVRAARRHRGRAVTVRTTRSSRPRRVQRPRRRQGR